MQDALPFHPSGPGRPVYGVAEDLASLAATVRQLRHRLRVRLRNRVDTASARAARAAAAHSAEMARPPDERRQVKGGEDAAAAAAMAASTRKIERVLCSQGVVPERPARFQFPAEAHAVLREAAAAQCKCPPDRLHELHVRSNAWPCADLVVGGAASSGARLPSSPPLSGARAACRFSLGPFALCGGGGWLQKGGV